MSAGHRSLAPTDSAAIRQANLALVLREVRDRPRARARIAADVGITKGTASSLVAELESRGLVVIRDAMPEGSVGRPGQLVQLVPGRAIGLGFGIGVHYLGAALVDLADGTVASFRAPASTNSTPVEATVSTLVKMVHKACDHETLTKGDGLLAGVAVAVPGLVDSVSGIVRRAPVLGWRDVPLQDLLAEALRDRGLAVHVDNDANLAALAEHRSGSMAGTRDLIYLSGGASIGGGIFVDGHLLRGAAGYAGEVGHMNLVTDGTPADRVNGPYPWESTCGLDAFLEAAAAPGDDARDSSLDLDARLDLILERARAGDQRTLAAFRSVALSLGIGIANLVNIFNPAAVVLGGYFARVGEFLLEDVKAVISRHALTAGLSECAVALSSLGPLGGSTGAAQFVLDRVFANPTLVPAVGGTRSTISAPDHGARRNAGTLLP